MSMVTQADVQDLNYLYLVQLRDTFKRSQAEACIRFHTPVSVAQRVAACTQSELIALAKRGRLMFKLELEDFASATPN